MDLVEYQCAVAKNYVLYSSNDEGANRIAKEMAEEYGVQNQVYDQVETPTGVKLLLMANSATEQAAKHLDRPVPEHVYIQTLLQRNFRIIDKAKAGFCCGIFRESKNMSWRNRMECADGLGFRERCLCLRSQDQ